MSPEVIRWLEGRDSKFEKDTENLENLHRELEQLVLEVCKYACIINFDQPASSCVSMQNIMFFKHLILLYE